MSQIHLLPSWNVPWPLLAVLAHVAASPSQRHHVAAWRTGPGRRPFDRAGIPTTGLDKRWPWDPVALWRWWRLLGRHRDQQVHLWGGLSEGAVATLVAAGDRTTLHVLDAEDLETLAQLEPRGADSAVRVGLTRPWYDWARERLPGWNLFPEDLPPTLPLPQDLSTPQESPPAQQHYLQQLVQGQAALVLGYDDGRSAEATKALLWAADILCCTGTFPVRFCFTSPCRPCAAVLRFWATLRTRRHIGWLPWSVALGEVFSRADLLWWNDAEDFSLLLPRAALQRRLPVAGWTRTLEVLQGQFPGQIACVEKDAYGLASASLPLLQQVGTSSRGVFVPLELGTPPS